LLATLTDQIQLVQSQSIDYLLRGFIDRIRELKPLFNKNLKQMIEDKKKYTIEKIKFDYVNKAEKIINDILKGSYLSDSQGEKIFYDKEKYVKLNYASSGQQEVIWILLLLFILILENKQVFIVIEEPEAHLYPESQKLIIDLISLLSNMNENQIIITTHSPYILAAFNNLLYAFNVGSKKTVDVSNIIDKKLWIDPDKLIAFYVDEGCIKDILDKETSLIMSEYIDSASLILNDTYDKLFNLDDLS